MWRIIIVAVLLGSAAGYKPPTYAYVKPIEDSEPASSSSMSPTTIGGASSTTTTMATPSSTTTKTSTTTTTTTTPAAVSDSGFFEPTTTTTAADPVESKPNPSSEAAIGELPQQLPQSQSLPASGFDHEDNEDTYSKRRVVTYDQRQEGQYNIRADLENFMIVLIPPSPAEGLNLLDLLTKSSLRRNSGSGGKGKRKNHYGGGVGSTSEHATAASRFRQSMKTRNSNQNFNYAPDLQTDLDYIHSFQQQVEQLEQQQQPPFELPQQLLEHQQQYQNQLQYQLLKRQKSQQSQQQQQELQQQQQLQQQQFQQQQLQQNQQQSSQQSYQQSSQQSTQQSSPQSPRFQEFIEGRTPYHVDISSSDEEQSRLQPDRQVDVLPPPYPLAYQHLIKPYHLEAEPTVIQALPPPALSVSHGGANNFLETYNQLLASSLVDNNNNINNKNNINNNINNKNNNNNKNNLNNNNINNNNGDSKPGEGNFYRVSRAIRGDNLLDTNSVATSSNSLLGPGSSTSSASLFPVRRSSQVPIYRSDLSFGAAALYPPIDVPRLASGFLNIGSNSRTLTLSASTSDDDGDDLSEDAHIGEILVPSSSVGRGDEDLDLDLDLNSASFIDSEAKSLLSDGLERCAPGRRRDSYGVCREIEGY